MSIGGLSSTAADVWDNEGIITVAANSTLDLGGRFVAADLGSLNRNASSTINLCGFLNNSSTTLALTNVTGSWNLAGGEIFQGTVTTSGTAVLSSNGNGTLDGITLNGTLNTNGGGGSNALTIQNGLTLNGTINISNFGGA